MLAATIKRKSQIISLTDSGGGVPDSIRHGIFQPGMSTTGGEGLGLHNVQMIAEEHGGAPWLAETGPKGSTFIFALPMQK